MYSTHRYSKETSCAKFDHETVDLVYSMYSCCSHSNMQRERITGPVSTIVAVNTSNDEDDDE